MVNSIIGTSGNDVLYGDPFEPSGGATDAWLLFDNVTGGSQQISGEGGDDVIYGDQITAGEFAAFAGVWGGSDGINGGDGNDTIYGDQFMARAGGAYSGVVGGSDEISGGDGNDIIYGDQVSASVSSYYYGSIRGGNDTIAGSSGDDTIYGDGASADCNSYSGPSLITGGDDRINAGPGHDLIYGDWVNVAGNAVVTHGHDTFIYLSIGDGGDTIGDFGALGEDLIDVSAIDANTALAGDQAFGFAGTVSTKNSMWLSDNGTNTTLYFDNNGDAAPDMSIVLLGVHGTDVSLADFVA